MHDKPRWFGSNKRGDVSTRAKMRIRASKTAGDETRPASRDTSIGAIQLLFSRRAPATDGRDRNQLM